MNEWLTTLALGALGVGLWRRFVAGRLRGLVTTLAEGELVFALAFVVYQASFALVPVVADLDLQNLSLRDSLGLQCLANLLAVAVAVALAWRGSHGLAGLGLRRHRGPSALLTAASGWLACLPLLAVAAWANRALLGEGTALQDHLSRFLQEDGASSPTVWLAMVVVIPIGEEIVMRGALYGGLREHLPRGVAMVLSGLVFGVVHDALVMLPVALLGVALAWLYERSGSLVVPCLVHALQNGLTLALASLDPELLL